MIDRPTDACGVVGLFGIDGAAALASLGLHALQHRGQESAGIVTWHDGRLLCHKGMGLVANVFVEGNGAKLPGDRAIGHVRYPSAGTNSFANAQPLVGRYTAGDVALAHNGSFSAAHELREQLSKNGALFQTTGDTELLLHMLAQKQATTNEEIAGVLADAGPAYALVLLFADRLIAARDPWGIRPLVLGRLGEGYVVASETCAFDQMGATYEREVLPGEMIVCDAKGCHSYIFTAPGARERRCLLEHIYFARPDSVVFGETPHIVRWKSGAVLAKEHPADVDLVVAIPDSGVSAAMGYASALGLPLERGLIRNHYVGRSFIVPGPEARTMAVRMKHNVVRDVVRGKRIVLVDDSLIRGTTTTTLGKDLREAGALEVHLRIACPPTCYPCDYGVDFPKREELMAYLYTQEEIREKLGMDSLGYLSLQGLTSVFEEQGDCFCTACWSGESPIAP